VQGALRNWQLQGQSVEGGDWAVLSDHVNDCSFPNDDVCDPFSMKAGKVVEGHMAVATFDIPENKQALRSRFLRIIATGPNAATGIQNGDPGTGELNSDLQMFNVACAGIEFWGELTVA
jgi:hypothetical protein